ncbi:hypothetical protein GCM10007893_14390 [Paracoccus marinus]|nr:hypothetical protein GCM10007893_14390 [Paracoccus marinus]
MGHDARAVEEAVQPSHAPNDVHDCIRIGDVEGSDLHPFQPAKKSCVEVGGDDLRTLDGQRERARASDSLACGRDEDGFSVQPHQTLPVLCLFVYKHSILI